ncbi:MAG: VWA domain-containing protein [Acidobacteria bacterium]|nr:VWA domain-containing protein [Acidobacteriota bacterium]
MTSWMLGLAIGGGLAALALRRVWPRRDGAGAGVTVTALGHVPALGRWRVRTARAARAGLLALMLALTAYLWVDLTADTLRGAAMSRTTIPLKTVLCVFDISSSMMAKYGETFAGTRFTVARDAFASFVERQTHTQVGLIFFSSEVLEYRRPTQDLEQFVTDLRQLDIASGAQQPLNAMSLGTETGVALEHAAAVLRSLDLPNIRSGAVILVSDLIDDRLKIANQINALTAAGIRVYVISIEGKGAEASEGVADSLALNPLVKAYHIRRPEDLTPVYSAIHDLETSLAARRDTMIDQTRGSEAPVRILLAALVGFVVVTEALLPGVHRGARA